MEYETRIKGSMSLGEFPVTEEPLQDAAAFHGTKVYEADSPDAAARVE